MSAEGSIELWVDESGFVFRANENPQSAFNRISKLFEDDGRSPLADILQEDTGTFLEFIEGRIRELNELPPVEAEFESVIRGSKGAERELKRFFKSLKGLLGF